MNELIKELAKKSPPYNYVSKEFIPGMTQVLYSGPFWDHRETEMAMEALLEGKWITAGEYVARFQNIFAKHFGVRFAHMVNSGSSANLVMISALKKHLRWKDGDEIIVSPVGFPTTIAPLVQNNLKPVFVDIEMDTLNFNLDWRFIRQDVPGAEAPAFDDAAWDSVATPHSFNDVDSFRKLIVHSGGDTGTYKGLSWYRKHFRLPVLAAGHRDFIEFEGMRQAGDIFLNGHPVGLYENGVTAYGIDITDALLAAGQENVLAVKVDNSGNYRERAFCARERRLGAREGGERARDARSRARGARAGETDILS